MREPSLRLTSGDTGRVCVWVQRVDEVDEVGGHISSTVDVKDVGCMELYEDW